MARLRKNDRRDQILLELQHHPHVRTSELAARFGVSTETVRRDVEALSREGLITRAYGGASVAPMGAQPPFGERDQARIEERARIARRAAELVRPGEVLMIDAGSTTHQFALCLAATANDLTVLTNSVAVASALAQNETIQVVICPGDFMAREVGIYGAETIDFIGRYNANRAFIGASGLTTKGITEANRLAVGVKRAMIRQSRETYLLADHTKFDLDLVATVEPLTALTGVITDAPPPGPLAEALAVGTVEIHIAR
ncbi:transcriptional regulator [Nitratireductor indicus C115]|uniref:Transcriptional regulator n=1 Tax=Nitratireductor indicus C115 TaxID=1231190 RepID=K2NYW1_9HYPH|nr:DeoR/GlpR family DNA-binding transcription regulator [Nitratireductor indicus]EKF43039.1 transcriptional regulator [Nitratireductor indicus C115]SFQ52287.1 transcriptional regulator, DeoR family [Nitratireductor indicus]